MYNMGVSSENLFGFFLVSRHISRMAMNLKANEQST